MEQSLGQRVVAHMMNADYFSQWLGIKVEEITQGYSRLSLVVRHDMLNGFGIAHGGITYSLADSALAFASNSHGVQCVSIETSISHTLAVKEGNVLTAIAQEVSSTNKIAIYEVKVTVNDDKLVAWFKGMVYRTGKAWFDGV